MKYVLPQEKIAQRPLYPPENARMLVVDRRNRTLSNKQFFDLPELLLAGDLIVFNQTKVIPARFFGSCKDSEVEVFLLNKIGKGSWNCIGNPKKKIVKEKKIKLSESIYAKVVDDGEEREFILEIFRNDGSLVEDAELLAAGNMPIPPYIRNGKSDLQDFQDYQTFWANIEGSVAAPTASLHFSKGLVESLTIKGIEFAKVTLHLGLDSILISNSETKTPAGEKLILDKGILNKIKDVRSKGRKVIAVGTSVVRALETLASLEEFSSGDEVVTTLYISPPYLFKACDAVITNFHMPHSTHIDLVSAFTGNDELLFKAYQFALDSEFRFLSYGDGMLII